MHATIGKQQLGLGAEVDFDLMLRFSLMSYVEGKSLRKIKLQLGHSEFEYLVNRPANVKFRVNWLKYIFSFFSTIGEAHEKIGSDLFLIDS